MVLINGVKYACERCIRGHRVTTCTHTDMPLTQIKPKGRPSTQCGHCREVRRIRNSHVKCLCGRKGGHANNCPCHVTGECTCVTKKKSQQQPKQQQRAKRPESNELINNVSLLSDLNDQAFAALNMNPASSSVSGTLLDPLSALDMDSLGESSSSLLSGPSVMSSSSTRQKHRPIGMDPLDNIKPVPVSMRQKRVGEITIPMDEYMKPLNKMNTNLTNFLNNINQPSSTNVTGSASDSPINTESPNTSNKVTSPDMTTFFASSLGASGFSTDLYDMPASTNSGGLLDFLDSRPNKSNNNIAASTATNGTPSIPPPQPSRAGDNGGGLDSFFPLHPLIGPSYSNDNELSYTPTGNSVSTSNLSISNLDYHNNNGVNVNDLNVGVNNNSGAFANNHNSTNTNNNNNNATPPSLLQQTLKRIPTGSSVNSHHSQLYSNQSQHSLHSHSMHHAGSHSHHLNNHFAPYPRRSSSFLSISSGHSIGSSVGSPNWEEEPQIITAEDLGFNDILTDGGRLATARTNTTVGTIDGLYQTRTYTGSQTQG